MGVNDGEDLGSGETYKKAANEGKMIRIFAIRTKIKESSKERVPEKSHKISG